MFQISKSLEGFWWGGSSILFFCLCQVFIWIGRDANEVERTGSAKIGTISILKRAQLPLHKKAPWKKCRLFSSRSIFLSFQPATTWALTPLGGAIFPSPPSSRPPSLVGSRAGTPTCGTQTLWSASGPASKKPHARSLPTRKASPHNPCIPELEPARQRHQQANNGYNTASGWAYEQYSDESLCIEHMLQYILFTACKTRFLNTGEHICLLYKPKCL